LRLGSGLLVEQAALPDGVFLDPSALLEDGWRAAEVGIGGRDVAKALMHPTIVVVIDAVADRGGPRNPGSELRLIYE